VLFCLKIVLNFASSFVMCFKLYTDECLVHFTKVIPNNTTWLSPSLRQTHQEHHTARWNINVPISIFTSVSAVRVRFEYCYGFCECDLNPYYQISKSKASGGLHYTASRRKRPPQAHTDTSSPLKKASHTLRGESEATVHRNANLTNTRKLPRNEEITLMPKLRFYADTHIKRHIN
jgi:hypothetical protein